MRTDWTVTVDMDVDTDLTPEHLEDLTDELLDVGGAVSGHERRVSAIVTVSQDSGRAIDAASAGRLTVAGALEQVGVAVVADVAVEAMTAAEAAMRLQVPTIPPLMGAAEVADLLGVSRQRVHQLAASHSRFPKPVVQVRMGPLWAAVSIEAFAGTWERRPGRPSKATSGTRETGKTFAVSARRSATRAAASPSTALRVSD